MSRSRKHSPCMSWVCYFSNKKDKKLAHRAFRAKEKREMLRDRNLPQRMREVSDTWCFSSDGLPYWDNDLDEKYLRK